MCVSEIMYEIILLGLYQLNLNAALHLFVIHTPSCGLPNAHMIY